MSLLIDTSLLSKISRKRLFEDGGYQCSTFPQNFKRPKIDAIPRNCGLVVPRIPLRPINKVPVQSSRISIPSDMKPESTKLKVSRDKVETLEQGIRVDHGEKILLDDPKLTNVLENVTLDNLNFLSQPHQLVRKNPSPKIRKGVSIIRTFPLGCGRVNHISKNKVLDDKFNVERPPSRFDTKEITGRIQDGHAFRRKLNGNSLKEIPKKFKQLIGDEIFKKIQGGTSSEYQVKQDTNIVVDTKIKEGNKCLVDWYIAKQDKEMVYNCEPAKATCGSKSQNYKVNDEERSSNSSDLSMVPYDNAETVVSHNEVREALNLFEEIYTKFFREYKAQSKRKGQASMDAATLLKKQRNWVNTSQLLGPIPGVKVGDRFRFRAQLVVIGLHHQFQSGIDYLNKDGKIFATSIVNSGRYTNDAESPNVLIYSGQGGNPAVANKKPEDQKLERGNLALKNSMDEGMPVRVIRGRQNSKASNILGTTSEGNRTYIYDGLYIVTNYWQDRGKYGKLVFMFQLNRIPDQPKLAQELFSRSSKKSKICRVRNMVNDISQGKEKMPIRAVNLVDDEKPPQFDYITNMIFPEQYNHSIPIISCDCTNGCSDFKKCPCTIKNGGGIPFNCNGAIVKRKRLVYECGPYCKCSSSCKNRVSQHGIRYQLEIFKTKTRGWGVRSRNYISSGSFICEYVGELLRDEEADQRSSNDEYLFDIGNQNDGDGFTIDAANSGNVGRFINHSCSPNLYAQNVLYDHNDKRMPHLMLFATENIPPLRELTYDYNYKLDKVRDNSGNIKKKNCYCGSRECSGRMY